MLTPDEITRGRELFQEAKHTESDSVMLDFYHWAYDNFEALAAIAEEHQKTSDQLEKLKGDYCKLFFEHQNANVDIVTIKGENAILVSENQCLKSTLRSNGELNKIESARIEQLYLENKNLKASHAADGDSNAAPGNLERPCWDNSEAKKKLEGK